MLDVMTNSLDFDRVRFLETAQKYSYFRNETHWEEIRRELFAREVIDLASLNSILKLIDKHSFAVIKSQSNTEVSESSPAIGMSELDESTGMLTLPDFFTQDEQLYQENYEHICQALRSLAAKDNLIIDLSENSGGNMYPWLAALSPLYDQKIAGFFEYKHKEEKDPWLLGEDGVYCGEKKWFSKINKERFNFNKIVLLISSKTSSSGEAVALSFLGQKNVVLVGQKTAGFTTGNEEFVNGNISIWLSTCMMQDRNGKAYSDGIEPDMHTDKPIQTALEFLTHRA
jgi:carboxyl-terminal processing protease